MTDTLASTLTPEWKDRLGLTHRRSPELYESADAVNDVPHAPAIRAALNEMGVSAIWFEHKGRSSLTILKKP